MTLWDGYYYYGPFYKWKKQRLRAGEWGSQVHKSQSWDLSPGWSDWRVQLGLCYNILLKVWVGNHSPVLTVPWKTVIMVGGKFRVGCVSLYIVNGFDYIFLASSFWERLPLVVQYNQIISYVNSRLAQSQRQFHRREGENETVLPAPESNLLFSRKRSRVNDTELGKGSRCGSEHYQEAGTKNGC